jgi:hypothetical protein
MKSRDIEKALDEAISEMKKGVPLDALLLDFPEEKSELEPLLSTIYAGIRLPRKEVPMPARRRKFLTTEIKAGLFIRYFSLTKLALMPLSLVLIFATAITAKANPGQPLLYNLKTAIQRAPLALIQDPTVRAEKEVALSEQNLAAAEKFLNSNHEDTTLDATVVAQVAKQASQTVEAVKDVARDNAVAEKNSDLLNKLVSIAQKQEKLVSAIKSPTDTPEVETLALAATKQKSTETVATVDKLVATVNEQVIANLEQNNSTDNPSTPAASNGASDPKNTPAKSDGTANTEQKPKPTPKPGQEPADPTTPANKTDSKTPPAKPENEVSGTFIIEDPNPPSQP